jgi:hypothetical protein
MSTQEETQEEAQQGRRRKPPELTQEQRRKGAERTNEIRRQKRLEQAGLPQAREASVLVPMELESVISGLRDKAKAGTAQAAQALLAYLTRFPVQQAGSEETWMDKGLEDMTPDELAFAEAYALRKVNRALRKAQGLRKAEQEARQQAADQADA